MLLPFAFVLAVGLPPSLGGPAVIPVDFPLNGGPATAFSSAATVRILTDLPLSPEAQAVFDSEFQATGYFGAFALSKDGGYGYSSGVATLAAAREVALAQCASLNGNCLVMAELVPEGYVPPPDGTLTLSQQVQSYFSTAAKNPDFQALAVSEDGAFAMYWGMASQSEADRQALTDCEANRDRSIPGLRDMPCVLVTNLP
jgi:hypothetical protein